MAERAVGTALVPCPASGWRMHPSNVDHQGIATCPQCEAQVSTRPDHWLGNRVRVIEEHQR